MRGRRVEEREEGRGEGGGGGRMVGEGKEGRGEGEEGR